MRYNYLNIPVMFQYKLTDEIYAELGPQLGVLLSAEVENNSVFLTEDTKDITKTVDFGLNVGAGYIMENGLGFNIRYNMGLTSVDDSDDDVDMKNSILSLGLSYSL
ncbi:MAG: outer membrane beta-barrel protein [Flavobacteriales bacterium]